MLHSDLVPFHPYAQVACTMSSGSETGLVDFMEVDCVHFSDWQML